MTINKGGLFDRAEPPINGWENQLGYRGYIEVWKKGSMRLEIVPNEDATSEDDEDSWEWSVYDEQEGRDVADGFGYSFDEADEQAKEWMRGN